MSLAAISRATGVSASWLQRDDNKKYEQTPREVTVRKKSKRRLTLQCDEMWSFVHNKKNKLWIWPALDVETREIVGVYVGNRDEAAARKLWESLPTVYRQCAVSYTDFWQAYQSVFPSKRHHAVGTQTGLTNHIERFNCLC